MDHSGWNWLNADKSYSDQTQTAPIAMSLGDMSDSRCFAKVLDLESDQMEVPVVENNEMSDAKKQQPQSGLNIYSNNPNSLPWTTQSEVLNTLLANAPDDVCISGNLRNIPYVLSILFCFVLFVCLFVFVCVIFSFLFFILI